VTFEGNFKCILNANTSGGVKYETVVERIGFRSTITLPDGVSCQGLAVASTLCPRTEFCREAAPILVRRQQLLDRPSTMKGGSMNVSKLTFKVQGALESRIQRCTTLTMTRSWNAERQQKRNRLHSRT